MPLLMKTRQTNHIILLIRLSIVLIFVGVTTTNKLVAESESESLAGSIIDIDKTQQEQLQAIKKIQINVNDIYDSKNHPEDLLWFQNFANTYHIKTKDSVVLEHLSVKVGEQVTDKDLREAERLLRKQSYLRDAVIHLTDDGLLIVDVVENWTMFPTLSFKRTGRQNSSSIGVRDTNLFGYGIASTFSYKKDAHKSGYRMRLQAPTESIAEHSTTSLILEDYDVGQQQSFIFDKPFYGLASKNMYHVSVFNSEIESTFDHNGDQVGLANTKSRSINLIYGLSEGVVNNTNKRLLSGIVHYDLDLLSFDSRATADLFKVRKQDYVWIGKERFIDEYSVQKNIHIMSNKEDINLGLIDQVKLGLGSTQKALIGEDGMTLNIIDSSFVKLIYDASFGHSVEDLLILQSLNVVLDLYKNDAIQDYQTFNYNIEFFYPLSDKYTLYNNTSLAYTRELRCLPL